MSFKISDTANLKDWKPAKVDYAMKTHENDPYFIKKAEKAAAILNACELPQGFIKTILGIGV